MKKLLAILGAFGMTVSASTVVVACGQNNSIKRWTTPALQPWNQILLSLANDPEAWKTIAKVINDIDNFEDVVLKMVQDATSRVSNAHFKSQINESLKLNKQEKFYQNQLDEIASDIAQNQFYLQYTNNLLTNDTTSLDEKINMGLDGIEPKSLNPKNLLKNENAQGEGRKDLNKYFIYMNTSGNEWVRWQYIKENNEDSENEMLPTISQLEKNTFIILRDIPNQPPLADNVTITPEQINDNDNWFYKNTEGNPVVGEGTEYSIYSKDGSTALKMNGKTALEYRFQRYFSSQIANNFFSKNDGENKEQKNFFQNLLTMTFLDSKFYTISRNDKTQSDQDVFLDITSNLPKTIQSWSKTDGYQSKLKMVWSFTLKSDKTQDAFNTLTSKVSLGPKGELNNPSYQTLANVYDLLKSVQENDSNLGSDPFFGFSGYNGLVKNEGEDSVTSVDGNFQISDEAKTKIAQAKGPSIITKNNLGEGYNSLNKPNEKDFILVLPIYLIDLLNDRTTGFDNGQSTTAFATFKDIKNAANSKQPIETFFPSYAKAKENGTRIDSSKVEEINLHLKEKDQAKNFYIYVDGAPYTIPQFNQHFKKTLPNDHTIWDNWLDSEEVTDEISAGKEVIRKVDGLQFTMDNTINDTIGNIGLNLNQWVRVGNYDIPADQKGFDFKKDGGILYVRTTEEKPELVGTVLKFGNFKLSFDDAKKDGLYTINGTFTNQVPENEGKTYSYKINMGPNASNADNYIKDDNGFNYYTLRVSSLDISNLSTEKKSSLLREIEFVTSNESGVADTAAGVIYPLFLNRDQILYQPLYNKLKQYLVDEDGGTSD